MQLDDAKWLFGSEIVRVVSWRKTRQCSGGQRRRWRTKGALGRIRLDPAKELGPAGTKVSAMRRWPIRILAAGLVVGAVLFGCDGSSSSDPDGGSDAKRESGGVAGSGGVTGNGGMKSTGGALAHGGVMSTGGRSTGLQWGDGGLPDHFLVPDLPPLPDLGIWQVGVPPCEAPVQQGMSCFADPATACVPTAGGAVCLCPAGTWMCF